jgi:predicted dehydrogenase
VYDYSSFPQIANNAEIDVVYVVVPTALHAQYAIAAAEAGKHVWCEKPMAMTAEECQRTIDACRAVNAIRYATGEEPVRVKSARQWADRPELFREVDESTEFEPELPSGVVAYGKASRFQPENVLRVEAQDGWYQLEPMQSYEGVKGQTSDGKALDQPIDHQQARQMDDDALAILEGRPARVPGEEGQRDIRILQAIVQAARTGAAVAF